MPLTVITPICQSLSEKSQLGIKSLCDNFRMKACFSASYKKLVIELSFVSLDSNTSQIILVEIKHRWTKEGNEGIVIKRIIDGTKGIQHNHNF